MVAIETSVYGQGDPLTEVEAATIIREAGSHGLSAGARG